MSRALVVAGFWLRCVRSITSLPRLMLEASEGRMNTLAALMAEQRAAEEDAQMHMANLIGDGDLFWTHEYRAAMYYYEACGSLKKERHT